MDIISYLLGKNSSGGGGGGSSKVKPKTISFTGSTETIIDLTSVDFSDIYNIQNMFDGCYYIKEMNGIENLNNCPATSANYMFRSCCFYTSQNEYNIDFSKLILPNIKSSSYMFSGFGGNKIKNINLSNFNPIKLTTSSNMFYSCKVTHIDLRSLDFTNLTSYTDMFGPNASNGVPDNCEIIVKDQTQKSWVNEKFTRLTNVKTVAEL